MKNYSTRRNTPSVILTLVFIVAFIMTGCGKDTDNSEDKIQSSETPTEIVEFEGKYIDVHTHIFPSKMSLEEIINNMDAEGIDKMVIMKVPANINDTQTQYGIPEAAEKYPDRFIVLYGGEAITMLEAAATSGNYTQADEKKFTALLEQELGSGKYRGIGEIGLRHFIPMAESNATDLTISGDHPWMYIMSDIAAKYNVPIDVHMEATAETIKGLESLLAHNKNTIIIWDHAGWANTEMPTPQLIGQLMEKYPNLYASIKIRKDRTTPASVSIFNSDKQITPEWISLFKKYPDRFMIGSDIKAGVREDEFTFVKDHLKLLSQLPPEVLKKIERENAEKIFQIE